MGTCMWFIINYLLFPLKWDLYLYQQSWLCLDNFKSLRWFQSSALNLILTWFFPQETNFYSFPEATLPSVICKIFFLPFFLLLYSSVSVELCCVYHAFLKGSHLCFITHYFSYSLDFKDNPEYSSKFFS